MTLRNDTATITMFNWTNRTILANRVEIDICWEGAGGNMYVFLDARLKGHKYVTIGMRQLKTGEQQASMSVFKPDIRVECREGFRRIGPEKDTCCIGNYPFSLNNWYRFILNAKGSYVEGFIYNHETRDLMKLARFYSGDESFIQASTRNSVSLEHIWMKNPCEEKTAIVCKDPLRMDILGKIASATRVQAKYQKCDNANIEKNSEGNIVISHGGNTRRGNIQHNDWIDINYKTGELIKLVNKGAF